MRIFNGKLFNVKNNSNFTCYTHNGQRVVDYLLSEQNNFYLLNDFIVLDLNEFSNHTPSYFSIKANVNGGNFTYKDTTYYKWKPEYTETFRQAV